MRTLIDRGRTWVKLSGAYQDTKVGPPTCADATPIAQAYVKAAPERMVWGSDWPHPTEKDKPDDAVLFDLLAPWVPDEATRNRASWRRTRRRSTDLGRRRKCQPPSSPSGSRQRGAHAARIGILDEAGRVPREDRGRCCRGRGGAPKK